MRAYFLKRRAYRVAADTVDYRVQISTNRLRYSDR
jgi:hypothetical protein